LRCRLTRLSGRCGGRSAPSARIRGDGTVAAGVVGAGGRIAGSTRTAASTRLDRLGVEGEESGEASAEDERRLGRDCAELRDDRRGGGHVGGEYDEGRLIFAGRRDGTAAFAEGESGAAGDVGAVGGTLGSGRPLSEPSLPAGGESGSVGARSVRGNSIVGSGVVRMSSVRQRSCSAVLRSSTGPLK
jgi:hypothetical protein